MVLPLVYAVTVHVLVVLSTKVWNYTAQFSQIHKHVGVLHVRFKYDWSGVKFLP